MAEKSMSAGLDDGVDAARIAGTKEPGVAKGESSEKAERIRETVSGERTREKNRLQTPGVGQRVPRDAGLVARQASLAARQRRTVWTIQTKLFVVLCVIVFILFIWRMWTIADELLLAGLPTSV